MGGLIKDFGKVTLLEFFVRSGGERKMAKLTNCAWTIEITRADRGNLEGANFAEYASFGKKNRVDSLCCKLEVVSTETVREASRSSWYCCAGRYVVALF